MPLVHLYRFPPAWGLPSSSPGCLEVECYLRAAQVDFSVADLPCPYRSPTGSLPALEQGDELVALARDTGAETRNAEINLLSGTAALAAAATPSFSSAFAAHPLAYADWLQARSILARFTLLAPDLDATVPIVDQGDLRAFTSLVHASLVPASVYMTWHDVGNFKTHVAPMMAKHLPFPLSYVVPWMQRRSVLAASPVQQQQYGGARGGEAVYNAAREVYRALDARFKKNAAASTSTPYLLGTRRPTSLDATVFAHVAFHRFSPLTPPLLRRELDQCSSLIKFLDHMLTTYFASEAPALPLDAAYAGTVPYHGSSTGSGGGGGGESGAGSVRLSKSDLDQKKWNRYWLSGVAMAFVGYLFTGGLIQIDLSATEEADVEVETAEAEDESDE